MSVWECQERVDSQEFTEWLAFWRNEPFGDEWRQTARLCRTLVAMLSTTGKTCKEEDFMPAGRKPGRRQSKSEMLAVADMFLAMYQG